MITVKDKRRGFAILICIVVLATAVVPLSKANAARKENKKIPVIVSTVKNNKIYDIRNPLVKRFDNKYVMATTPKHALTDEKSYPKEVRLAWKLKNFKAEKYVVSISEDITMSDAYKVSTKDQFVLIDNLKTGTKYYWTVAAFSKMKKIKPIKSEVNTFRTKKGIRTIKLEGVSNARDIGGYKVPGGKVKQGMVYRTATLDGITAKGRREALKKLKIRTDIDLREPGEDSAGKGYTPLGKKAKYLNIGGIMYTGLWGTELQKNTIAREVKLFANEKNYPIVFHCTYGRDRTGTLAFLLNGYLGVKKKDLFKDYEMLFFSTRGCSGVQEPAEIVSWLNRIYKRIKMYGGAETPYSKKVELFLRDAGVSNKCLQKIKTILIEEK